MKKFIENIGNTSTTVRLNGKYLGHNVNASAYAAGDGIHVYLESNGSIIKSVSPKVFNSLSTYSDWKYNISESRCLFAAAIESFGATVCC